MVTNHSAAVFQKLVVPWNRALRGVEPMKLLYRSMLMLLIGCGWGGARVRCQPVDHREQP